ncbi:MAG TPA: hydrolase [Deltaproteobacteria bacterium]|jgi:CubicO group peptidase (beta-lactamase class C family)|nr:hydrolase [Deltaproteobacteria bacterium]
MDCFRLLTLPARPFEALCRVPRDLGEVTTLGSETPAREVGIGQGAVEGIWQSVESLYRTGLYPAIEICIRRRGALVLNRTIGHASGNAPGAKPDSPKTLVTPQTPILLFSASKAITAMVIHKLDERRVLHLDDRVIDYIPEFAGHGKEWITLRHVLCHRAGIPNLPPGAMDLDLLERPEQVVEILCAARTVSRPGRNLAYHAVSGGFVLGEVVRRATGKDIRAILREEIQEPLGLRWLNYGVSPIDLPLLAHDVFTGPPILPPFSQLMRRALGVGYHEAVALSHDPRFRTGIIPAANVVATAEELSAFYQCLLNEGEFNGVRVFEPRTVRHATSEQSYWELDLTLGLPLRYGLGFMLGAEWLSLFGPDTPHAFGHLGFTNIFSWADPERALAVAILTTGKPFLSLHVVPLWQCLIRIGQAFPRI